MSQNNQGDLLDPAPGRGLSLKERWPVVDWSELSRKMQSAGAEKIEMWWSQSQIDYMRSNLQTDPTGMFAQVVREHDRVYHETAEGTCCRGMRNV